MMAVSSAAHWDDRYRTVGSTQVSWFQAEPTRSLELIDGLELPKDAPIVDVGGGASLLVDRLVDRGFTDITVVDLSQAALDEANGRLSGSTVAWVQADVRAWVPSTDFVLWHDRAVYHFLTDSTDQQRYWQTVRDHVPPGGHVVIATFAEDGPEQCSGLPVQRYSARQLQESAGAGFDLVRSEREVHVTPSGGEQAFTWLVLRRT